MNILSHILAWDKWYEWSKNYINTRFSFEERKQRDSRQILNEFKVFHWQYYMVLNKDLCLLFRLLYTSKLLTISGQRNCKLDRLIF